MAKTENAFIVEQHDVLGGKATVLRTTQSGKRYQLRMWVSSENRYMRKSLRTENLTEAKQRAEQTVIETLAQVQNGKKIFGLTIQQLVIEYLQWRKEDVETKNITAGRHVTLSSQLKHFVAFAGATSKVASFDMKSAFDYANWRRLRHEEVRDITIRNEQTTINHMMKFAFREGHSHFTQFEFRKLRIRTEEDDDGRRGTFTLEQYDELVRFMRTWSSKAQCGDDEDLRNKRLMIRDCILIASNTMLRVGELWQLKWGDIEKFETMKQDGWNDVELVTLRVKAETSKNRRTRVVTARGGEYFQRLMERVTSTESTDYIFCGKSGDERFSRKHFYAAWKELMTGINLDYEAENITWYSLRHFGITCRLKAGASIYEISKIAGTSVGFIEKHYGHFDESMAKSVAMKNFSISKDGILVR
jgi:integrase